MTRTVEKMLGEQPGYGKWAGMGFGSGGRVDREQAVKAVRDGRVAVRVLF